MSPINVNFSLSQAKRKLFVPIIILLVWFLVTHYRIVNPLFLPGPSSVLAKLLLLFSKWAFYFDIGRTLWRALAGLVVCIVTMVPLGLILGQYIRIYEYFGGSIDFLRSLPSSALYPLFILFFGIGDAAKIAVVFFTCSLIVLVNTMYGARPSPEKQDRINSMNVFGATRLQLFREVVFRDALPHIAAGIRIALSLSLILVIVTEMFLGTNVGLGKLIYDCYLNYRVSEMYAVILITGLLGFILNRLFVEIEKKIIFWTDL